MTTMTTKAKLNMKSDVDSIKDKLFGVFKCGVEHLKEGIKTYSDMDSQKAKTMLESFHALCIRPLQSATTLEQLQDVCDEAIYLFNKMHFTFDDYTTFYDTCKYNTSLIKLDVCSGMKRDNVGSVGSAENELNTKYTEALEYITHRLNLVKGQLTACIDFNKEPNDPVPMQAYGMIQLVDVISQITNQREKTKPSHDVNKTILSIIHNTIKQMLESILTSRTQGLNERYPILKRLTKEALNKCVEMIEVYNDFTSNRH